MSMKSLAIVAALLWLACCPATALRAHPAPPAGWLAEPNSNGTEYIGPGERELVNATEFVDQPNIVTEDVARKMLNGLARSGCATSATTKNLYGGQAVQLDSRSASHLCTVIAGRAGGVFHLIVAVTDLRAGTQNAGPFASALARHYFAGNAPLPPAAQAPARQRDAAPPAALPAKGGGAILAPVRSSGTEGIWVGLSLRTVYDPVTAVRLEYGTDYLVLTRGGYFMRDVPDEAGFTDQAAIQMAAKSPDRAGRVTVQGANLLLRFASGETMIAKGTGQGANRTYRLDNVDFSPKLLFRDGTMLNGSYSSTRITRTGTESFVVGDTDLVFTRDGRFAKGGNVTISGGFYSIIGGDARNSGTYFVKDSAVHLRYGSGQTETLSMWAEKPNDVIWFNGEMHKLPSEE